jgi:hypothetical protein
MRIGGTTCDPPDLSPLVAPFSTDFWNLVTPSSRTYRGSNSIASKRHQMNTGWSPSTVPGRSSPLWGRRPFYRSELPERDRNQIDLIRPPGGLDSLRTPLPGRGQATRAGAVGSVRPMRQGGSGDGSVASDRRRFQIARALPGTRRPFAVNRRTLQDFVAVAVLRCYTSALVVARPSQRRTARSTTASCVAVKCPSGRSSFACGTVTRLCA